MSRFHHSVMYFGIILITCLGDSDEAPVSIHWSHVGLKDYRNQIQTSCNYIACCLENCIFNHNNEKTCPAPLKRQLLLLLLELLSCFLSSHLRQHE